MAYSDYLDVILPDWYTINGQKTSVLKENESQQIIKNKVLLEKIPDPDSKINIIVCNDSYIYEVPIGTEVTTNTFTVDYTNGILTFDSSLNGQTITIPKYYGRGNIFYPASRIYDELNTDGTIKTMLSDYIDSIRPWQYKGNYDSNEAYVVSNQVTYEGGTYICTKNCTDISPTNTSYWKPLATGLNYKGSFDDSVQYLNSDIVYYQPTKSLYFCNTSPDVGTLPSNTTYWKLLFQFSAFDYDNNLISIYCGIDNSITLTHNLNTYPLPHVVNTDGTTFGHGGFGMFVFGGTTNSYQVFSRAEYPNKNSLKLYLEESFNGTPTITQGTSSKEWTISFSADNSIKVLLLTN